jgi:hypothetical protein
MNNSRGFYVAMMVVGTIGPWYFFSGHIGANGVDLMAFMGALYGNQAAGGAMTDLLISAFIFWVWSYGDARENSVGNWWLVLPATLAVGLSLALPLYLWMRAGELQNGLVDQAT